MSESISRTIGRRFVRMFLGIVMGWVLVSLHLVAWLAVGSIYYGDADTALQRFPREGFGEIISGTIVAGGSGCWVGALIAPVVLGVSRAKHTAIKASIVGFWVAEAIHIEAPKTHWVLSIPALNGVMIGLAAGWTIGRKFTDASS